MNARLASVLAFAAALACATPALAQAPSATVTMTADRTRVAAGERFQLRIEARCQGASNPDVQPPALDDFDIVRRHVNTPFSLSFGFGGGQQQVQSTVRHIFILVARQPGRFELPPAVVTLGGQRFESAPLTIEVTDGVGGVAPTNADPNATPTSPDAAPPGSLIDGMEFDPGGFIRTIAEPADPVVGQQVTVTVYLYVPNRLRGNPAITQEPTADGFWVQDLLPPSRTLTPQTQTAQGRRFEAYTLRRFAAFPLSAGDLTIGPTEVTIDQRSVFDMLGMGGGRPTEPWVRASPTITVPVRELPAAGRPDGPVHVGTLSLSAELDRTQIATGDAVTLTLTANGTGAMEQLTLADPEGDGLRVLRPEIRDTPTNQGWVVGGTRILRWLIVPEREGDHQLGPFEVAVFDPASGTYSVARAEALTLTAAGSGPPVPEPSQTPDEETRDDGDDEARASFGPVRTQSELARSPMVLSEQAWFFGTLALGPLALLFGLLVQGRRRQLERDDPKAAPKRARKAAKKRLLEAQAHADADEPGPFYAAIASALKQVLEAKLGRAVGSLTHPELLRVLDERGMNEALRDRVVDELEGCDFARFSAVGVTASEMQDCLGRAGGLLTELSKFEPTPEEES